MFFCRVFVANGIFAPPSGVNMQKTQMLIIRDVRDGNFFIRDEIEIEIDLFNEIEIEIRDFSKEKFHSRSVSRFEIFSRNERNLGLEMKKK